MKFLTVILIIVLVIGCDPYKNKKNHHKSLWFVNHTEYDLIVCEEFSDTTIINCPREDSERYDLVRKGKKHRCITDGYYEDDINMFGKLYFAFYDLETVRTVPLDTICKHRMYLFRRSYTAQQLDSADWVLTLP